MTGARQPVVLVAHDRLDEFRTRLTQRFPGIEFAYATDGPGILRALDTRSPEVVFSIKSSRFAATLHRPIVEHPSVKWVQVGGSGYEHLAPWDAERLTLTNCAGVLARYLAETVTGAMLALNGGFLRYWAQQRAAQWRQHHFVPLCDKTLLVIGVGAIGGRVAENAKALGMRVLGIKRSATPHPAIDEMLTPDRLFEALGHADFVSLHLRATPATRRIIGADALDTMKPGAVLINTARGAVVDETALVVALRSGRLAGAYLDVFESEPLPPGSPLWALPNVMLTPHAADSVPDWTVRFADFFADNLQRWLCGEQLVNVVTDRN